MSNTIKSIGYVMNVWAYLTKTIPRMLVGIVVLFVTFVVVARIIPHGSQYEGFRVLAWLILGAGMLFLATRIGQKIKKSNM